MWCSAKGNSCVWGGAACTDVDILYAVSYGTSASLPVVCFMIFIVSKPTGMMKSLQLLCAANQATKSTREAFQNGCRPHGSTTMERSVSREQCSYGMKAKAPLRAIKYSSAIRHWALGSTLQCEKPPGKLVLKTKTMQWRERKRKAPNYLCFLTNLFIDEQWQS